jgi:hypothetical protein
MRYNLMDGSNMNTKISRTIEGNKKRKRMSGIEMSTRLSQRVQGNKKERLSVQPMALMPPSMLHRNVEVLIEQLEDHRTADEGKPRPTQVPILANACLQWLEVCLSTSHFHQP